MALNITSFGGSGIIQPFPRLYVPNRYQLVSGTGDAPMTLNAFDRALRAAGAGDFNLVKVSSILPAGSRKGVVNELPRGAILFSALGSIMSDRPGEVISAAVSVGIPADHSRNGVLMEGSFRCSAAEAEEKLRQMARTGLEDRGLEIESIESIAAEHQVRQTGAAMAAVLMWIV